jgi:hypothetical protein
MAWTILPAGTARPAGIEEADKFAMAMRRHAAPEDGAVQDIERGEQRGDAVAFVVVRQGPAFAGLERQAGLGAVASLDLRLLVDRPHHGMGRGLHVEAECRGRRYPRPSRRKPDRWSA